MRILLLIAVAFALFACSRPAAAPNAGVAPRSGPPPAALRSLPPDATHREIEAAMEQAIAVEDRTSSLREMADASKRIFAWQATLNAQRAPANRLRFDRDRHGIPIDEPFAYNAESVRADFRSAIEALDPEMRGVIEAPDSPLPPTIATSDAEFEKAGAKVIAAYDNAMRWESLSPYLDYYRGRVSMDIRGYYFLQKVDGLENKLAHWNDRPAEEARTWGSWLVGLCRNDDVGAEECESELRNESGDGNVLPFYQRHVAAGRELLRWYFSLVAPRADVQWNHDAAAPGPTVPFTRPAKEAMASLTKTLIEAAWKSDRSQLRIAFTDRSDEDTPHLVFEAGALPHVNRYGGSEITLDENIPADNELDTSILQHEFGHVIGFPDCYVEFYDEAVKKMINYQIDVNNLMCSRTGKVTDLHWNAIRNAYATPPARLPSSRRARPIR